MIFQIVLSVALLFVNGAAKIKIGEKARDFALPATSGETISLASQRGRVVLINFWATWCGPCQEELPELDRLQNKFRKRGLSILAISVDNEPENVKAFLKKYDIKLLGLWDRNKKTAEVYAVEAMPSSYLVDRNGIVRAIYRGYDPKEFKRLETEIEALLAKSAVNATSASTKSKN